MRLQHQTRLKVYPGLVSEQRPYQAAGFAIERVWRFVSQCVLYRRLSNAGVSTYVNRRISTGKCHAGKQVEVQPQTDRSHWEGRVNAGPLKTYAAERDYSNLETPG